MKRARLLFSLLTITLFAVLQFTPQIASAAASVNVSSVKANGPSSSLTPKQTFQLKPVAVTTPKNQKVTFKYSSNNSKIAQVSSTGLITAVSPGKATIYISAGGKTANVSVTVKAKATDKQSYTNARFGFQVQFPSEWKRGSEPTNGDGIALNNSEANKVLAYASFQMFDADLEGYSKVTLANGDHGYKRIEKSGKNVEFDFIYLYEGIEYHINGQVTEAFYKKYQTKIDELMKNIKMTEALER